MIIDVDIVKEALGAVMDPVFEKPMLELETLRNIRVDEGTIHVEVQLSTASSSLRAKVEREIQERLAPLEPKHVHLDVQVRIPTREVGGEDPLPKVRNVILVMSGKGGVGKSTTAVNLTLALKGTGARVGILDADVYGPSIPTMMGINGQPVSNDGKKIAPLERFGVKMMSIGFLLEDEKQAVVWRGPMLNSAIRQFITDVDWGPLDYLVVDLPPGTGDVALSITQQMRASGAVVVTTPQEVALQDVYKSISMCEKLKLPILGVVENMSYFIDSAGVRQELFGRGGGQKVADFAKAPLLGQVPMESDVREWGDKGMPVVQSRPESDASKVFDAVAESVASLIARRHFERSGGRAAPPSDGPRRLKIVR